MTNPIGELHDVFTGALRTVRDDIASVLERIDQAVDTIKTTAGVDPATGAKLPPDPAFARGNRPLQDASGGTADPAFDRGNTAAATPQPVAQQPPDISPPVSAVANRVIQLRDELAKAEAEAAGVGTPPA